MLELQRKLRGPLGLGVRLRGASRPVRTRAPGLFGGLTPPLDIAGAQQRLRVQLALEGLKCVACAMLDPSGDSDVRLESARTAYSWGDKTQPDPNAPIPLCRPHAAEHHDHWDSMWAEYHASIR